MREVVIDIEATGLLDTTTVDYSSIPYKLKPCYQIHCIVAQDINTKEIFAFYDGDRIEFQDIQYRNYPLSMWRAFLKKCKRVIGHNIIDYDLLATRLYFDIPYTVYPDTIDGRDVAIEDTLVLSKLLNPDRFGGHSLASWGRRLGKSKIDYNGGWEKFTPDMLYYCIGDVELNTLVWKALRQEWGDWNWNNAYQLEKAVRDIITKQSHVGFKFNKELAEECYKDLCEKMEKIEKEVEPLLPKKPITKGNAKEFTPPRVQFLKTREISSHMQKWLDKHGGTIGQYDEAEVGVRVIKKIIQPRTVIVFGKEYELPMCSETPVVTEEKMTLADQTEIKKHLISLGWIPNTWKEKDITLDTKKRKLDKDKYAETVERYVEDTLGGEFESFRCEHLGVSPERLREALLTHNRDKPLKVLTSPSFTIDSDKNLCPNLLSLGDKVGYVADIVKWLTYRHRRNSIYSPAENSKTKTKDTGWLVNPRIEVDGRIPTPADTCGAVTRRFTHREVANIPRVTSLYGDKMRSLFMAEKGKLVLGMDFDALEARIEGHYTRSYRGGKEYAKSLISPKPFDLHCYSEDTEILTDKGWRRFNNLNGLKVAQWSEESGVSFVEPSEVVWQEYKGEMYSFQSRDIDCLVTPNHKMLLQSYRNKTYKVQLAEDLKRNSYLRLPTAGVKSGGENFDKNLLTVVVATQADGYLMKDCSGISLSFVRQEKVDRLSKALNSLGVEYSYRVFNRKGRDEKTIYINSSPFTTNLREVWLTPSKSFSNKIMEGDIESRRFFLDELKYWDGTKRGTSTTCFDSTDKTSVEVVKYVCTVSGIKCHVNKYIRKTRFGECITWRALFNTLVEPWAGMLQMDIRTTPYQGMVGCVSVPSGFVLVRRNGKTIISGNTTNAQKMGVSRDDAKILKYSNTYGAQPRKIAQQMGWDIAKAQQVYNAFWEAASPLGDFKRDAERFWQEKGEKKFVVAIDGAKLWSRSKHSIVNLLFQSCGVICAKRAMVWLDRKLKEENIQAAQLIQMHDELQLEIDMKDVQWKMFPDEESAGAWKREQEEKTGRIFSDVGHAGEKYYVAYHRAGELAALSARYASDYYKLRVPLTAGYQIGRSWAETH